LRALEPYRKELSEDELEDLAARQMLAGRLVQAVQLKQRAKGKPLGAVSAKAIIEMEDKGEIEESSSGQVLRKLISE
jgi:hypothetical protein